MYQCLWGQPRQQKNSESLPQLMVVLHIAKELSKSATSRGIEHPGKRSSWRPIGFHIQDVVVTLLFLALCVGGICCKGVLP